MTIKETLRKGMIQLKTGNVTEPNLKARLIMQYILNKPRQYLIIYDDQVLTLRQEVDYFKAIKRLINGEPIQHITHQQEFMKLSFFVNEDVLIPRPDTEILVEEVIKIAKKIKAKNILDMCTGSGAIAVSLAKYLDNVEITAVDISTKTLNVAKTNAKNNEVENKITFIESNLFENIVNEKYDIIVSNPPYIKTDVIPKLDKQVQNEPHIALDGGKDGLKFYKIIIEEAKKYLEENGKLILEIGYDQKEEVENLIKQSGQYKKIEVIKDLSQNDRVIIGK